ncbi:MAG: ribosomal-processing cysteine protease Prp [Symbiobacteriaceae bacterium]|nr:ribosomal-processing cysteine protease Prp [Symbiobacteriaceae bacterium]
MTEIFFIRDTAGRITSFSAKGHSGFAPKGDDIVCAAVSALLQAAVFSLSIICVPAPQYSISSANLSCCLPTDPQFYSEETEQEIQTILKHTLIALMNITLSHPSNLTLHLNDPLHWQELLTAENSDQVLRTFMHASVNQ